MNPESIDSFLNWQAPYRPSLVQDRLLVPGSVMFIYGEYSTWKSWLAMDLAHSLADGKRWLIWNTLPTKVLIINAELPKGEYQDRWKAYLAHHKIKFPTNLMIDNDQELNLDSFAGINNHIQWLIHYQIKVIIIDNLYTSMIGDLTKNTDTNVLIRNLKRLASLGIAIVPIHHARQERFDNHGTVNQSAYEMFGSSFLTNWADTILETRNIYVPGHTDTITFTPQKHRLARLKPLSTIQCFNRSTLDFNIIVRTNDTAKSSSNERSRISSFTKPNDT
jgi:archaellum biogenesis ATPase FlaH